MTCRVPLWQSPVGERKKGAISIGVPLDTDDETLFENPEFQHDEQTTYIQLFFDLFFVANLTTFTNKHEINSLNHLLSYMGFFCILWFTWCQVTLYDVRFATDSVIERIFHACHFGVMVGLATVGLQFDPQQIDWDSFQWLSLILTASRLTLLIQYSFILGVTWKYKKFRLPLGLVITTFLIAATLYLCLSFAFSNEWGIANIAIAYKWHDVSFKKTSLVERMTCLTLIVLGEGVIGLTSRIALIEYYDFDFSRSTIGTIISSVLIIYFVYQLYFDNVQMEYFGSVRQQWWAFLHVGFHLALVLLMEGINQFVVWRHAVEQLTSIFDPIKELPLDATNSHIFSLLNKTTYDTLYDFWPKTNDTSIIDEILEALDTLSPAANVTGNVTTDAFYEACDTIVVELFKIVVEDFGFEAPEEVAGLAPSDQIDAYYKVFHLIFAYFFISAGVVLIGIAILSLISMLKEKHTWRSYVGFTSNFLIGLGLALISTMLLTDASGTFGTSPWILPLVAFVLLIALSQSRHSELTLLRDDSGIS